MSRDSNASDRYLWDGTGQPDADIVRLEQVLAPLRHERPLDETRVRREFRRQRRTQRLRQSTPVAALATAAVVLLAMVGFALWPRDKADPEVATRADAGHEQVRDDAVGWAVSALEGRATADGQEVSAGRLPVGAWLETGAGARARLAVADIGTLELREHSRLRIVTSGAHEHRVELARGQIHALIDAPPRLFLVETAAAVAVDLGCEYTLDVDERGQGRLHVHTGYVALERDGVEAFVPAGARCELRPGVGPGTPYREDASERFLTALLAHDQHPGEETLARVLELAERGDTVSLWNLFTRALETGDQTRCARIYERLAALSPPPEGATRARLLAGDGDALTWWRMSLEDIWLGYEE